MKKIEIFVGSDSAFEKIVPKSARNLSEMAAKLDDGNKKMDVFVNIPGQPEPKPKKKKNEIQEMKESWLREAHNTSALHRRRNQIGQRFERPERVCKTAQSFVPAQGEPPSDPDRGALRTLLAPPFVTKRWLNPLLAGNAESKVRNFPEESIGEFIFS